MKKVSIDLLTMQMEFFIVNFYKQHAKERQPRF